MTRAKHASGVLLIVLLLTAWTGKAHAHPTGMSFRLGLGLPALSTTYYPSPDHLIFTYGLYPVTFGVQLGLQVSHEIGLAVLVYGGGLWDNTPGTPGNAHFFYFAAAPRFEYMFWPHGTVAPYFGFEAGVEINGFVDNPTLDDYFRTGAFFGLHIFALTEFSVDLELAGNFIYDIDRDLAGFRAVFYISVLGWLH